MDVYKTIVSESLKRKITEFDKISEPLTKKSEIKCQPKLDFTKKNKLFLKVTKYLLKNIILI